MSARLQRKSPEFEASRSSSPGQSSSRSDGDHPQIVIEERKRKRMESNRESARRSRARKQHHLDELLGQVTQLQTENSQIVSKIGILVQHYQKMEGDNTVLRAQITELTDRLQYLNSVLHIFEDFGGVDMDIPEMPDAFVDPWQLPCTSMPIIASADMFQC